MSSLFWNLWEHFAQIRFFSFFEDKFASHFEHLKPYSTSRLKLTANDNKNFSDVPFITGDKNKSRSFSLITQKD